VDEKGLPLVVYHGTGHGGFISFDRSSWKTAYGHFFTPCKEAADFYSHGPNPKTFEVFLAVKNPLRLDKIVEYAVLPPEWLKKWIADSFEAEYGEPMQQFYDWIGGADLYSNCLGRLQSDLMATAEENGHDGVAFFDSKGGGGVALSWVVFEPTQIRDVTNIHGSHDPGDPNVTN
jgi:hypothetical protein